MLDREALLGKLKEIGTTEDQVEIRDKIADIRDHIDVLFSEKEKAEETNKSLLEDNEKLREANMKLFLKVGSDDGEKEKEQEEEQNEDLEKRKFEDLFDEKGGLK